MKLKKIDLGKFKSRVCRLLNWFGLVRDFAKCLFLMIGTGLFFPLLFFKYFGFGVFLFGNIIDFMNQSWVISSEIL